MKKLVIFILILIMLMLNLLSCSQKKDTNKKSVKIKNIAKKI
jgi:uncharacterized secreted protein with C-terminal beta-propeller domain